MFGYTLIKQSYLDAIIKDNKTLSDALKMNDKEIVELKQKYDRVEYESESFHLDSRNGYYVVEYPNSFAILQSVGHSDELFRFIYDHKFEYTNEEEKAYAKLRCEEICELLNQDRE